MGINYILTRDNTTMLYGKRQMSYVMASKNEYLP